mgnify:CR=1 FL=1
MEGEMSETRMKGFSGGQKARVIFAQLTYQCPHLLIMDEPTNFLDLESVDSLITACNKYPGAMLLVTHSRHMLHSCGNIYLSITPGKFSFFENIKDCERATYSFIKDVEEGGKVKMKGMQGGAGEQGGDEEEEEEARSAAKEEGIKCGYHLVEPDKDKINNLNDKGYNMIAFSVDIRMLDVTARLPFNLK